MFKYKVNSRLLPEIRALPRHREGSITIELTPHARRSDPNISTPSLARKTPDTVRYPLFKNHRKKGEDLDEVRCEKRQSGAEDPATGNESKNGTVATTPLKKEHDKEESELNINVELDFGWLFGWLERSIWLTMFLGVGWALAYNFKRATSEVCNLVDESGRSIEHYPFNVLPSLSRSMSSFRVGKFLWTLASAAAFIARLLSNHFLHRLYVTWYEDNWFNKIFLGFAYLLDTLEIISLIMIPAFSLDCDASEHSFFFRIFICLTFAAEVVQYCTRFLKRKKTIQLFSDDVNAYYRHIGILILLQLFFIAFMMTGYILHDQTCSDFVYSMFTLGEYITVVINVRFKRDTILFVK